MKKTLESSEDSDLLVRLNHSFKGLSKGQKQIASFIMENYDKAAFITASKMGRIVGVSESTVVRFAYTLGYDGYPELQKSLQDLIRNKLTSVQRIKLTSDMNQSDVLRSVLKADMANIRATIDSTDSEVFNTVVDELFGAEKIYIIGIRSALPLAQLLAYYLGMVLDNVVLMNSTIGDVYESLIRITGRDACIGISFPRYSARTIDALKFAKTKGARIIAITDSTFSPISELADHSLIAKSDMASFADSLVAPLSLINALIVACSLRRKEDVYARLSQLESLWGSQRIYATGESDRL
ncbi:MAG: HTH-type transcriptional regulator MurR [Firmicutes bacterium ADurb.Bin248]|nr:MAG: HTH-type transcriptional regulator MurR [Firmicutes bacterium ADurb.Bin248]HOG00337.1 MurR/RpiR family transcriptional regulator [Clostridia bacterium]HPK16412.1 MurR/RpiR family transcriptional regulator [Clostridia bacterium]